MVNLLKRVVREESAQDLAEYGIALAVIAAAVALIALAVGNSVVTMWSKAQTNISSAAST